MDNAVPVQQRHDERNLAQQLRRLTRLRRRSGPLSRERGVPWT